jgi:hypothetical protein
VKYLELSVCHGELHQRVRRVGNVPVSLPVVEVLFQAMGLRRNESGIVDRAPRRTYPVLAPAKASGCLAFPPHAIEENTMKFEDKVQTERPFFKFRFRRS